MHRNALIAFSLLAVFESTTTHADPQEDVAAYRRDFQSDGEGVVIGIIKGDTIRFGHAGHLKKDGPPVDENTLFEIGSITKTFTGILLADAVLKGKATLEDSLAKHLPEDLLAADSPLRSVTLLDLATHTSGLPRLPANLDQGADPNDPYAHYSVEKLYEYLRVFKESDFEKRGELSYSNLGMGLLGHLLERIAGKPYKELITETIFTPLGMNATFVQAKPGDIPANQLDRVATGHSGGRPVAHWHLAVFSGAGAIVSSARDVLTYAGANWSPRTPESLKEAMALATKPQRKGMGLGWFIGEEGLNHDGGTGGFRSELRVNTDKKTASVKLMNSTGPSTTGESSGDFTTLSGYWDGILDTGSGKLHLLLRISPEGAIVMHSLDQGGGGMPAAKSVFAVGKLSAVFAAIGGSFEGTLTDGQLTGTWKQGKTFPLTFTKLPGIPEALTKALKDRIKGDLSGLAGFWSGYLGGKNGLFVIVEIESFDDTGEARLFSPDQSPEPIAVSALAYDGKVLALSIDLVKASYNADVTPEGKMTGSWKQGPVPQPLTLTRSEKRPVRE